MDGLDDHWCVAMRDRVGDRIRIVFAEERNINLYHNACWNCRIGLSSEKYATCPRCGWLTCPVCGACMKKEYGSQGLVLPDRPGCYQLTPEESEYYVNHST